MVTLGPMLERLESTLRGKLPKGNPMNKSELERLKEAEAILDSAYNLIDQPNGLSLLIDKIEIYNDKHKRVRSKKESDYYYGYISRWPRCSKHRTAMLEVIGSDNKLIRYECSSCDRKCLEV